MKECFLKKYPVRTLISLCMALCMLAALLPVSAGAVTFEVDSPAAVMQTLAETSSSPFGLRASGEQRTRILVLEPALPDACGAQRVVHYAAGNEYVLEFASRAAADNAYTRLTETYRLERCWLDTPENGAHVMEDGAAAMEATTWGASYMNLTAYRSDSHILAHFNAVPTRVAIIDSGIDPDNTALHGRSFQSFDFVNGTTDFSEVSGSNNARGHGTRVASILDSVLPENVQFMYLRVFDDSGSGGKTEILNAILYAAQYGAAVANLSLGWPDDTNQTYSFLDQAMAYANAQGTTLVCAAGNNATYVENCYPANSRYTVAVSSVNRNLQYEVYSNYGEQVDFCAPGSGITATTVGGNVVSCAGTSFAAPHITAAATLLKIVEPAASTERVYTLLRTYAKDLGIAGKDNIYGWGIPVLPAKYTGLFEHMWDEGRVTVPATARTPGERVFTCQICGETRTMMIPATGDETQSGFVDVPSDQYFAAPVAWAASNGITTGTDSTHFSPNGMCTRAQVVTFLWRAAGAPRPSSSRNPFTDVPAGSYYYNAVLWAVENGITKGTSDTAFSPDASCTRAQVVTFLWRAAGSPSPKSTENPFGDVSSGTYYYDAVLWAVENNITNGTSDTVFSPDGVCTRAQVVTFLYRYRNPAQQ